MSHAANQTDIYDLRSYLSNLDVVPLLGALQRLQVVTGGVVVDQFSPPFGDFFLHIDVASGVCCQVFDLSVCSLSLVLP